MNEAIKSNMQLQTKHTFGLKVNAKRYQDFNTTAELQEIVKSGILKEENTIILGGGSNILFLEDFNGLVLHNQITGIEILSKSGSEAIVFAGGGENWHRLVSYCVDKGLSGIENLALIPGNCGAAPMQNIGAYGVELKDVFYRLHAVDLSSGETRTFYKEECEFGYRESVFKHKYRDQFVITGIELKLQTKPELKLEYGAIRKTLEEKKIVEPGIRDVFNAVIEIRRSKLPDPEKIGNAGSFFKNPEIKPDLFKKIQSKFPEIPNYPASVKGKIKIPAGWLIEKAGWKGKGENGVATHDKQALVIVNKGVKSGKEVWEFASKIRNDVKEKFGIQLMPEVNLIPRPDNL